MIVSKLVLIFTGAFLGAVVLFFGGLLAIIGLSKLGVLRAFMPFNSFNLWIIVSMTAGGVIGGSALPYFPKK